MKRFDFMEPETLEEASLLLSDQKAECKIIAGGTDVIVRIKEKKLAMDRLVSLSKIKSLRYIRSEKQGVDIGAMSTMTDLENSELIKTCFPVLFDAMGKIGSVQIRNVATLGGNLCNAAPSADTAPPLLALDAEVRIWRSGVVKTQKLEEFFVGPSLTVLGSEDILTGIHIKRKDMPSSGAYLKFSRRKGMDIPLLGIAVQVSLDESCSFFEDVGIALGVAAPTPARMRQAEYSMKGEKITDKLLDHAADLACKQASPRDSMRCSSDYRMAMIRTLLPGVIKTAVSRIEGKEGKSYEKKY